MDGTTRCPHCETRFKIGVAQLEAHKGMVRCGKCMQIFDARPEFIADQPSPQLELVIAERSEEIPGAAPIVESSWAATESQQVNDTATVAPVEHPAESQADFHENALDFVTPRPPLHVVKKDIARSIENDDTIDESVHLGDSVEDEEQSPARSRTWLWALPAGALSVLLIAQLAYVYRAEIAARQPDLRPMLQQYCELLDCKVGLPQNNELMSIESSSLEADPNYSRHITLKALLRNRASYDLAYPDLELTLNDRQDSPLARRIFKPAEYLATHDKVETGLPANHEANVQLQLDTTDLNPNGYRLVLYYPAN